MNGAATTALHDCPLMSPNIVSPVANEDEEALCSAPHAPNAAHSHGKLAGLLQWVDNRRDRAFGRPTFEWQRSTTKLPRVPIVRTINDFNTGYPKLAAFQNSMECFMIYRRFGYLQARLLLEKQDELRLLEEELDVYDKKHEIYLTSRMLPDHEVGPRKEMLSRIEQAFNAYATALGAAQQMMTFNQPSNSEYDSVHNFLDNNRPIKKDQRAFIRHREDLVTLRPGREHAWLDRCIERSLMLIHRPLPCITRLFCSQASAIKSRSIENIFYSRERINLCASFIITLMILALLMVPIYLLYHLVSSTGGILDGHTTATCIGILLTFTLLFSMVLSLFTRAKRHEILGASAAYCAVLVVFLGNVP